MANYNSAYTGAQIDAAVGAVASKANDSDVVHNTGNETVAGVKTFSSFPVTPSNVPTANYQVANKKYIDDKVKTDVPAGAKFTDTVTTINGKTGAILKSDIVALGIPAQDTVYTHPATHPASMITDLPTGKKVARFVIGTSTAGWTAADCDYLCDGTADQTEINAAITALPATGGEIVILDGTYNITAKIDITKDNVSIRGNGNATILRRMYDSTTYEGVITLTSRSGCKIANLQVDGNKSSYTRFYNTDIYLGSSSNNTITSNTCNNGYYCIYLGSSSNNTITGNTYNDNHTGIYLGSSSNNTITGNACNNNTTGINLASSLSDNNTITGNTCNNNNRGIYLSSPSNDNIITSNTCNNNNAYGMHIKSLIGSTITGNTCNSNGSGIYLELSSNNTVTSNTCNNNNNNGIYLTNSINNTITSNTCIRGTGLATDYTESQYTIRLTGTSNYNLIAMNNCMGKAVTNEGGTGNTLVNNKFDET